MAEALTTAGKLAKELNVAEKKIKEAIAKAGVEPDAVKGACKYYGTATIEKIKAALEK
jgi:hypothetical protein